MSFKPLGERIAVTPLEKENTSPIALPENYKPRPTRGKVVAVGKLIGTIKVGEVVHYHRHGGNEIEDNGKTLLVLRLEDVLGVES